MKIGIFGGSFNPPHNMHKKIAVDLIEHGYVDKVIFVPTGNRYPKAGLISGVDRYHMVRRMILDEDLLEVSDYEIKNKLVYTYQTLDYFKSLYPRDSIYFICGMDNFKKFNTWKRETYIMDNYGVIVINRGNCNDYINNENVIVADILENSISSTEVRDNIRQGKIKKLVKQLDNRVIDYIEKNGLYKES